MKFKSATIKDFKRFTDLTVQSVPDTARLILLAGPNGCGKSSFFDALIAWRTREALKKQLGWSGFQWDPDYHDKANTGLDNNWQSKINLEPFGSAPAEPRKAIYVRSAYRNDPEFQIQNLSRLGDPLENLPVARMINNDAAVSKNFQRLVGQSIEGLFVPDDGSITLDAYKKQILGDIRNALSVLFPELKLDSLGNPLEGGTFRFTKGLSTGFSFKNLSGGEKAAFDLILDLIVARRSYDDTLFCIDEPESHMNARLQAELLSVLYDLIPKNCQLMLATHSIGMMRRARDIETKNPGSVVFLDFGDRDFDKPQIIEPAKPDRTFWERAHKVALDDLAALVAPKRVVICEGEPMTSQPVGNHSHDARCYERIFEDEFPETRFVSMGNDWQVVGDKRGLAATLLSLIDGLEVVRLIDRDDRTEGKIAELRCDGIRVLSKRNLESYLFDDEVLRAFAESVGKADKAQELLTRKESIRTARTGNAQDDLKPASGQIYVACKEILGLTQHGNTTEEFMQETLAPLIKPGLSVYDELKRDIFGVQTDS